MSPTHATARSADLQIVVDDLEKRYARAGHASDIVALDRVSLRARGGERIGLIGRNGSGKSTLLQLIAGIASPSAGRVTVDGRVSAVLTLGMGLREELSGRENVSVDAALQNLPRERWERLAQTVLEFADLGEFGDRPVKTYSTGMKSRLAFSMLVTIEPEILLIDETLSVGDARFAEKATARMRELCAKGGLVIVVSHALEVLRSLCDRCIWLDRGRVRADGPAGEIIDAYAREVRAEDDREAQLRLARDCGARSFAAGWSVGVPEVAGAASAAPTLSGAEAATFDLKLRAPPKESAELALEVVRLDGLPVYAWRHPLAPNTGEAAQHVRLRTPRLGLGPGTYRLTCGLRQAGALRAEATTAFEVAMPPNLTGGLPVLDVAWRLDRRAVSERGIER